MNTTLRLLFAASLLSSGVGATELGIKGTQFTLDGKPMFLYGISYYDALGAPEAFVRADLDDAQKYGFNWIRVWTTWAAFGKDVSVVDSLTGAAREPYLGKLQWLVQECDRRGMVVDVTISRGNSVTGPARLQTHEAHRRAVETLVTVLKPYRNWYLDLSNERSIRDRRFTSIEELKELRERVRELDAARLVTASDAGDISQYTIGQYLQTAKLDFLAPHLPRGKDSAGKTAKKTQQILEWVKELKIEAPLHYQEPFRRGFQDWQPKAEDFLTDLRAAKANGAAGWCFHNGHESGDADGKPRRCFDIREKQLFDQLDTEEMKFVKAAM